VEILWYFRGRRGRPWRLVRPRRQGYQSTRHTVNSSQARFWPTLLSVVPLARCVVCLSVCLSVTFCIVAKRYVLAKKCLKEFIGNQGEKVHFGVAAIFLLVACMFPEERRGIAVIGSTSIDPWVAACVVVDVRHRRSAPLHATDGHCGPVVVHCGN